MFLKAASAVLNNTFPQISQIFTDELAKRHKFLIPYFYFLRKICADLWDLWEIIHRLYDKLFQ